MKLSKVLFVASFFVLVSFFVPKNAYAANYYISKDGNNSSGNSWLTAWNELDQINWNSISPGDTIFIDGGQNGMVYNKGISIGKSGAASNPITIQASDEANHNGQITFFGGRTEELPYCGQASFDNSNESNYEQYAVQTNNHDYITIDGLRWHGIVIHGYSRSGVRLYSSSNNISLSNLQIYNNGYPTKSGGSWTSDSPGIILDGKDIIMRRLDVHDNGQDSIQGGGSGDANLLIEESWLHNTRKHPNDSNKAWNDCTHTDGLQIYRGGVYKGLIVKKTVIGPGFMQNLILGQTPNSYNESSAVQDVVLEDLLLFNATGNSIYGYHNTDSRNWKINRVTLFCPDTTQCLNLFNKNHSVTDSIVYKGRIYMPQGLDDYSGNCVWDLTSSSVNLGQNTNPNFVDVNDNNSFYLGDFTSQNSACKGSRIASVDDFMEIVNSDTSPTPSSSPSPSPSVCLTDFNKDGKTNLLDYSLFASNFFGNNLDFDLNYDDRVDLLDYSIFAKAFFTSCS